MWKRSEKREVRERERERERERNTESTESSEISIDRFPKEVSLPVKDIKPSYHSTCYFDILSFLLESE